MIASSPDLDGPLTVQHLSDPERCVFRRERPDGDTAILLRGSHPGTAPWFVYLRSVPAAGGLAGSGLALRSIEVDTPAEAVEWFNRFYDEGYQELRLGGAS